MSLWRYLLHGSDAIDGWTQARAVRAEREMLIREGIVVEPHYLWSAPAKAREQAARINREQSWRKVFDRGALNVARFGRRG